jgi:(p)ppGpp synthase/HD superfamily hydrolase
VTPTLIETEFGETVRELVVSVTEEKQDQQHRNISWKERKITALEHIPHFSQGSVLVKSADVLSNGTELADDYEAEGPQVFDRFNASAGESLVHYERVIEALLKRWPESPLAEDLKKLSKEISLMKEGI